MDVDPKLTDASSDISMEQPRADTAVPLVAPIEVSSMTPVPTPSVIEIKSSNSLPELVVVPSETKILERIEPVVQYTTLPAIKLTDPYQPRKKERSAFNLTAIHQKTSNFPVHKALQMSHKYVSTRDWMYAREEVINKKVAARIDELRKTNLWSLKQIRRHKAPPRTRTSQDFLLEEMVWL